MLIFLFLGNLAVANKYNFIINKIYIKRLFFYVIYPKVNLNLLPKGYNYYFKI